MEILDRHKLQYGEIYIYEWGTNNQRAVVLYTDNSKTTPTLYLQPELSEPMFKKSNNFAFCDRFYNATPEQKLWLRACMQKGEFISEVKLETQNQYDIY